MAAGDTLHRRWEESWWHGYRASSTSKVISITTAVTAAFFRSHKARIAFYGNSFRFWADFEQFLAPRNWRKAGVSTAVNTAVKNLKKFMSDIVWNIKFYIEIYCDTEHPVSYCIRIVSYHICKYSYSLTNPQPVSYPYLSWYIQNIFFRIVFMASTNSGHERRES